MASIRTFTWGNPGFTDLPFGLRQAVFAVGDEGRSLTWYGPSLVTARDVLLEQLAR